MADQRDKARDDSTNEEWRDHEHSAASVDSQAQRLLDEAGSPELAKRAVDEAAHRKNNDRRKDKRIRSAQEPDSPD